MTKKNLELTQDDLRFYIDLLNNYKGKIYLHMRKNKYHMEDILRFIDGFSDASSILENTIYDYINYNFGLNSTNYAELRYTGRRIFDYTDIDNLINEIVKRIKKAYSSYPTDDKWHSIGIKYVLTFIKFYIDNIIFGDDMDVEDDLYMDIPDKEDPESYDWIEHGYIYDF